METDDLKKIALIFFIFVIGFPFYFFFVPITIAFIISAVLVIICCVILWKEGEKHLTIILLVLFVLSAYFMYRMVTNSLRLLLIAEAKTVAEVTAMALVFSTFMFYLPLLLVFLMVFAVLFAWAFFTQRGSSTNKFAILIGYLGVALYLILVAIDLFIIQPNANPKDDIFEVVLMTGQTILIPFNVYFFIQFASFYMTTFTFIVAILSKLSGSGGEED